MGFEKVSFINSQGKKLAARLERPDNQEPHSYAIFAHCFTCNKNFSAVRNISRALVSKGIAVLRFDFTGLGESEGEFEETNFSSNVSDLIEAAKYLEQHYKAPSLLIGHSLGGAAVIFAASELDSVAAVSTIGAPSSPAHVQHLFKSNVDEINATGKAKVNIGGRDFTIKKDFIDDIESKPMKEVLKNLRKPYLVLHSPQDTIVGIENAKELYQYAHHPKSFISIDKADHLLMDSVDSTYVGNVIAGWAERYLDIPKRTPLKTSHQVAVSIGNEGFTSEIVAGNHLLIADEPKDFGGNDFGPSPYDYVSSGLGACTAMTLRMYASRKKWDLQKVIVHVDHGKEHAPDSQNTSTIKKIDTFKRSIELFGDLDDSQKNRLMEIADKCPVHKTLSATSVIITKLK
ncbi:osmotically inducible protein C [Maribacter sp. 6B07]|uniref:bifunctional alpha/beta hydrolase/OsmC family protein n=1 Tax=Maribacter TaxID=252356 RepID=UPI000C08478C|nr:MULTISPECIES: bifunctional alpha/beta hydrolase/OsmC family protein [Maribacter]MBU2900240.1 bifunctional alpha/beta hydrolase/OsmC family protein [Maribacter dokdonensis]PHN94493.1 osmotically inducible protein C [Maribacter sp. 6B07]